jgi:hypothetical protein
VYFFAIRHAYVKESSGGQQRTLRPRPYCCGFGDRALSTVTVDLESKKDSDNASLVDRFLRKCVEFERPNSLARNHDRVVLIKARADALQKGLRE